MLTDAQLYHFAVHGWVLQEERIQSRRGQCLQARTGSPL